MKACGALSRPSTTSSRYLILPSRSQRPTSVANSRACACEVPDDEAADGEALRQDGAEDRGRAVGAGRQLGHVVVGDEPADRHAREVVEEREHRVPHRAADVLEIDVDALRAGGLELLREIRRAVVDGGVEAELLDQRSALVGAAGDADRAAALDLRDLADERADRPGRRGDDDGLAGLRLADVEETRIGGHARHAEHAERGRGRRRRGVDLAQLLAVEHGVFLPAAHAEHEVAGRELRVVRAHHLADGAAGHDLADADRLGVGLRVAHAPAHVRVEREPERAQQHLARAGLRDRRRSRAGSRSASARRRGARRARCGGSARSRSPPNSCLHPWPAKARART